jgi:hypothetical protein
MKPFSEGQIRHTLSPHSSIKRELFVQKNSRIQSGKVGEKKMEKRTKIILRVTALTLLAILLLSTIAIFRAPTTTSNNIANAASWNPAVGGANKYHAPLSSMGLMALDIESHSTPIFQLKQNDPNFSPDTNTGMQSIPVNALRFIKDNSYMPQSETTISVDPTNTNHIVGGVNDARYFFCPSFNPSVCPSGWTYSLSGFTTSSDGGTSVAKSNDLPGLNDSQTGGFLVSWGDPSVAATTGGRFYYASLAIDPNTGANGVELSISNDNLWSPSSSCITQQSTPWTNPCWRSTLVYGNLTANANSFEDKELVAVDWSHGSAYYGDAYVAWDHFLPDGTTATYLARCTPSLACVMLSGGGKPVISGNQLFPVFATPAVDSSGNVHVTFCNYGTFTTEGPITCYVTNSPPGGTNFGSLVKVFSFMGAGTMMPTAYGIDGYATEQFRTSSIEDIASDNSGVTHNLYWVIAVCVAGDYYPYYPKDTLPGDCGSSAVIFSKSDNGGKTWTFPNTISDTTNVNIQPWVTVDSSTGEVSVVYYTTAFDAWHHRTDVVSTHSANGGTTWTTTRLTSTSDEVDSDPALYNYLVGSGFGGSFIVPQYGDYFQATALGGKLYVSFTGSYTVEEGTFQADPYLLITSG